jgi:hypothetical protein
MNRVWPYELDDDVLESTLFNHLKIIKLISTTLFLTLPYSWEPQIIVFFNFQHTHTKSVCVRLLPSWWVNIRYPYGGQNRGRLHHPPPPPPRDRHLRLLP